MPFSTNELIKRCLLCDHAYDYHRVKVNDDQTLFINCVRCKYDNNNVGCNAGFKSTVKIDIEVSIKENN